MSNESTIPSLFIQIEAIPGLGSVGGTMIIPNPGYQEYTDEVQETLKEESESIFLQPKQG